jgi:hypothetical protein
MPLWGSLADDQDGVLTRCSVAVCGRAVARQMPRDGSRVAPWTLRSSDRRSAVCPTRSHRCLGARTHQPDPSHTGTTSSHGTNTATTPALQAGLRGSRTVTGREQTAPAASCPDDGRSPWPVVWQPNPPRAASPQPSTGRTTDPGLGSTRPGETSKNASRPTAAVSGWRRTTLSPASGASSTCEWRITFGGIRDWRAVCSCGWASPSMKSAAKARHLAGEHKPSRPGPSRT